MENSDESSEEHAESSENSSEVLSDDTVHEVDEEASIAELSDDIEQFTSSESDTDSCTTNGKEERLGNLTLKEIENRGEAPLD